MAEGSRGCQCGAAAARNSKCQWLHQHVNTALHPPAGPPRISALPVPTPSRGPGPGGGGRSLAPVHFRSLELFRVTTARLRWAVSPGTDGRPGFSGSESSLTTIRPSRCRPAVVTSEPNRAAGPSVASRGQWRRSQASWPPLWKFFVTATAVGHSFFLVPRFTIRGLGHGSDGGSISGRRARQAPLRPLRARGVWGGGGGLSRPVIRGARGPVICGAVV